MSSFKSPFYQPGRGMLGIHGPPDPEKFYPYERPLKGLLDGMIYKESRLAYMKRDIAIDTARGARAIGEENPKENKLLLLCEP